MALISIVIPFPEDAHECLPFENLALGAPDADVEVILVDGSASGPRLASAKLPYALHHVHVPGAGVFALRRAGMAQARGDWIIATEEHCRLMPGIIEAYRDAIAANPRADLFAGGIVNESPPEPWATANFLYAFHEFWPRTSVVPQNAAIANLAIRRSAILERELAINGGFEFVTLPRLSRAGRQVYCPLALVDHVQNSSASDLLISVHFKNGKTAWALGEQVFEGSAWARAKQAAFHCVAMFFARPRRVAKELRTVHRVGVATRLRFAAFGIFHVAGMIAAAGVRSSQRKLF